MDVPFTVTDSVPDYVYAVSNVIGDDWEQSSSRPEEWDNWEEDREPIQQSVDRPIAQTTSSSPQTFIQDQPTSDPYSPGFSYDKEEWEDWEDYQESEDDEFEDEFEEDEFEDESVIRDQVDAEPSRAIYEVQQTPKSSYRSGSIYSYSYRDSSDSTAGETEPVDHADYRVIIPPYQPDSEPMAEAAVDNFAQDDFAQDNLNLIDLNQDDLDRDDRPKPPESKPSDDEDW